jgi:hypothetical protein
MAFESKYGEARSHGHDEAVCNKGCYWKVTEAVRLWTASGASSLLTLGPAVVYCNYSLRGRLGSNAAG